METKVKLLGTVMILVALFLAGFFASVQATTTVPTFTITFDEAGNATISINGGTPTTLTGTLMSNPSNVGLTGLMALTYILPASNIGNGDVLVSEGTGQPASDAIRFTNVAGTLTGNSADRMIYYSDQDDPVLLLADTGLPTNLGTSTSVPEIGLGGGANGFTYSASSGADNLSDVYNVISDPSTSPVPEPSSFLLLGTGLLGLVGYGRKKWNWLRQS
jgi:hypothetical protein